MLTQTKGINPKENPLETLNNLLSVDAVHCGHCIGTLDCNAPEISSKTNTRFHYVKFDANGQPMLGALAETLYQYILHYCVSSRNRDDPLTEIQAARLVKEARKLFIHPLIDPDSLDETGEAGEMLLYFLIESVLEAPQVVSKIELKTNQNLEVHGSDGIHMKWSTKDNLVDVFFGEAKIYKSLSGALDSAFSSITAFHDDKTYSHELVMVNKHFKFTIPELQQEVKNLLRCGEPSEEVRLNHACLIGYSWEAYKDLLNSGEGDVKTKFLEIYEKDVDRVLKLLKNRLDDFEKIHLNLEFFFIPFDDVQNFRNAFNTALD